MTRGLAALILLAGVAACVQHNPEQTRGVVVYGGGPVITAVSCPSQSPHSQFRVVLGSPDATLEAHTGTLIFEVRVDSTPGSQGAQISVRNESVRRDMPYSDSVTRVSVPAGGYLFRARRIGAQTLQGSIEVRSGFADTVRILLGEEKLCPA
jgi:hypothetical protein